MNIRVEGKNNNLIPHEKIGERADEGEGCEGTSGYDIYFVKFISKKIYLFC